MVGHLSKLTFGVADDLNLMETRIIRDVTCHHESLLFNPQIDAIFLIKNVATRARLQGSFGRPTK